MRRPFFAVGALVAGLALVAAGCGGKSGSSGGGSGGIPDSASIMPASAPLYVYANTDFSGDQWTKLNTLLSKFPDRSLAIAGLQQQLQNEGISWDDVKSALGPDTGIAATAFTGSVTALLANKANDQAKLDSLIQQLDAKGNSQTTQKRTIDGFTVVSDKTTALDASEAASKGTSLADSQAFQDAFGALPSDALVKVFVDGKSVANAIQARGGTTAGAASTLSSLSSLGASVGVTGDGIELDAVTKGALGTKEFKPELLGDVPAGTLVYIGFSDVGSQLKLITANPQFSTAFAQISAATGVTTQQLISTLSGEGAFYVRPGSPFPEVTLVLADGGAAGVATLDKLTSTLGTQLGTTVQTVDVGGVSAKKLTVRSVPIYYANVDGKLVITDSETGITGLASSGDKLSDDPVFKEATKAAGLPDQTTGLIYVNIKDTVPLIDSFASIAGQALPPQATSNLEHVRSFVAYGTGSGDTNTFKAFLEIK